MAKEIPFAKGLGASLVEKSLAFKALLYSEQCLSVGLYSKAAQQAQECAELSMKAGTEALHGTKFKHLNRQHDLKVLAKALKVLLPRVKAFIQSEANQGGHETSFANGVIANTSMGVHFKRAEDHPEPTKAKQNQPDAS